VGAEALVAKAGAGGQAGGAVCWIKGLPGNSNELSGHKKTVSESETVAGQQAEKITEMPKAKLTKPIVVKTLRSTRGSLLSRVPRFVNKFFG